MNLSRRTFLVLAASVFAVIAAFIFFGFLSKPQPWSDEALNIQMARFWAEQGRVGIPLAPGVASTHLYYYTSSSGWVVLASEALAFRAFGASLFVARSVMVLYLFGFFLLLLLFLERHFGRMQALLGTLFVGTFASVYANGKSVLGEIPGFFFLLLGLWAYDRWKERPVLQSVVSGLGVGMFLAAKPAFALTAGPALVFVLLFMAWRKKQPLVWIARFFGMIVLAMLPSIWNGMIHPLSVENVFRTLTYYSNNYNSSCVSCDVKRNLTTLFTSSTFLYFDFLLLISLVALWLKRKQVTQDWRFFWLLLTCTVTALYFLKSPGTNRYLLIVFVTILGLFPVALQVLGEQIPARWARFSPMIVIGLAMLQGVQFVFLSDVPSSDGPVRLERRMPALLSETVGPIAVINAPVAAALLPTDRIIQFVRNNAYDRTDGMNILTRPEAEWPEVIIYQLHKKNTEDINPYQERLDAVYPQKEQYGTLIVLRR